MVGAQLEGFDRMVKLSHENDFILLEGDEYLSSALDRRPKFHLYKANIALLSGIAWDHINVFPSWENYVEQFRIFLDTIVEGGSITYNTEDPTVKEVVENCERPIRKIPYKTPAYHISNGITFLETNEGPLPIEIFGKHNMNNLAGAKWICQHMGIDEEGFYEAIPTFKGASKRLEKLADNGDTVIFKDFAHSPSKVMATTQAVKDQYPDKKMIACLELHTYSSLNPEFLKEYNGAMDAADLGCVYYSPEALKIKRLDPIDAGQIKTAFGKDDLITQTDPDSFREFLEMQDLSNAVLLLMSSGNYGGLDLNIFSKKIWSQNSNIKPDISFNP